MIRCVELYHENKTADHHIQMEFFDKGFIDGMNRARGLEPTPEPPFRSYSLQKAYRNGYRKGWDDFRKTVKTQ